MDPHTHTRPINKKRRILLRLLDVLIVSCLVVGLYLVLNPLLRHWQQDRRSDELIENFDQGDGTITFKPNELVVEGEAIESFSDLEPGFGTDPDQTRDPLLLDGPDDTPDQQAPIVVKAIGKIQIPAIQVNMPIAEGASVYNLRVAIGRYSPSAPLGQAGQSILFGHRMYTYGRHFNRLGEVEVGHQVIVEDKAFRYTYTVDRIDRVLPQELLTHLYASVEGSRLMLVTCDPVRVASHRLLVSGQLTHTEAIG